MAACPKTLLPLPLERNFKDDVFISDTDEGLLMNNDEDYKPVTQHQQVQPKRANEEEIDTRRDRLDKSVRLCVSGQVDAQNDGHSDVDSVAVVEVQPRRASEPNNTHFQPSQIEEKLLNHQLLNAEGAAKNDDGTSSASRSPRRRRASIWNGVVACLSPVVSYFKKEKQSTEPQQDEWEIDFADISELDFIGSGAQGAVFAGEYLGKKIAVKKVKDPKYCEEAWNMRKLDHPNIVKMM